jgi:hypothetical protein
MIYVFKYSLLCISVVFESALVVASPFACLGEVVRGTVTDINQPVGVGNKPNLERTDETRTQNKKGTSSQFDMRRRRTNRTRSLGTHSGKTNN